MGVNSFPWVPKQVSAYINPDGMLEEFSPDSFMTQPSGHTASKIICVQICVEGCNLILERHPEALIWGRAADKFGLNAALHN